jgi:hypothetical protein
MKFSFVVFQTINPVKSFKFLLSESRLPKMDRRLEFFFAPAKSQWELTVRHAAEPLQETHPRARGTAVKKRQSLLPARGRHPVSGWTKTGSRWLTEACMAHAG